jgi:glycosyltransferase involved in cell wall biosynthesis
VTVLAPKVSIGVPVYNSAATLRAMLDALLSQTLTNFEIVISDNASTDATADICRGYAERDSRIRYIRQVQNIGAEPNFKFVLGEARAPYFMWSAGDDIRSPEFLEENVSFLELHPDYVASTCTNVFEQREETRRNPISFSLEGAPGRRMQKFFDHCWVSHGIFYGVIRTEALRGCDMVGKRFFANDWAIDLYLARRGNIHRTKKGQMVSGAGGASTRENPWRQYYTRWIDVVLPFHHIDRYVWTLSSGLSYSDRLPLFWKLLTLNLMFARYQLKSEVRTMYNAYLRPRLKS